MRLSPTRCLYPCELRAIADLPKELGLGTVVEACQSAFQQTSKRELHVLPCSDQVAGRSPYFREPMRALCKGKLEGSASNALASVPRPLRLLIVHLVTRS